MTDNKPFDDKNEMDPSSADDHVFQKIKQLKEQHPERVEEIDQLELEIKQNIIELKRVLEQFDPADKQLMSVLSARGIHQAVKEILVEGSIKSDL